jgi:hypothetical protein
MDLERRPHMPKDVKEPQSYGSGRGWVEGRTGEQVNNPKSRPAPEHSDFYDDSRNSETSGPHQGGKTSAVQMSEKDEPERGARPADEQPVGRVTAREGGAKRDSYFKRRDYE